MECGKRAIKIRQQSLPRRPRKGAGGGERLNLGQMVGTEDGAASRKQCGWTKLISAEVSAWRSVEKPKRKVTQENTVTSF